MHMLCSKRLKALLHLLQSSPAQTHTCDHVMQAWRPLLQVPQLVACIKAASLSVWYIALNAVICVQTTLGLLSIQCRIYLKLSNFILQKTNLLPRSQKHLQIRKEHLLPAWTCCILMQCSVWCSLLNQQHPVEYTCNIAAMLCLLHVCAYFHSCSIHPKHGMLSIMLQAHTTWQAEHTCFQLWSRHTKHGTLKTHAFNHDPDK